MKKFICFSPRQSEDKLHLQPYQAVDNQRLQFGDTRFPIIPVIAGYAEQGEGIRVFAVTEDYPNSLHNLELLRAEVRALCDERGIACSGVEVIDAAYDDSVMSQLDVFQKLINIMEDDDELFACITYGSKPAPIVELMALRYARMIKHNAFVRCVVYGQFDHETREAKIYDVTALAQLDDIVRVLGLSGVSDPAESIKAILSL